MAHNREGAAYPGQYSRYQAPGGQQPPYQTQYQQSAQYLQPQEDPAAARPSFETGDDSSYFPGGGASAAPNVGAAAASSGFVRMPEQSQYLASTSAPLRAHSGAAGGQYVYPPAQAAPATYQMPAPYNPQQYAHTEQPHSTSPYGAPALATSPTLAHQPYVPAAYQAPTSPTQSYGYPLHEVAARRQQAQPAAPGPALPPRPHAAPDLPPRGYTTPAYVPPTQTPQYQSYTPSPQPSANGAANVASTYTPPRPPPPPTSLSSYYNEQLPHSRTYQNPPPDSFSSSHSRRPFHQRYPSASNYSGSGDYTTTAAGASGVNAYATPSLPPRPNPPAASGADPASRHPQSRPLPSQPPTVDVASLSNNDDHDSFGYDQILQEVEAAVMGRPTPANEHGTAPKPEHQDQPQVGNGPDPLFSSPHIRQASRSNGVGQQMPSRKPVSSSDSDAEAAAGLAALRMAEEQDAADRAYRNNASARNQSQRPVHAPNRSMHALPPLPSEAASVSDSDRVPTDLDTYGVMPGNVLSHYGPDFSGNSTQARSNDVGTNSSTRSGHQSDHSSDTYAAPAMDYYMPSAESIHPFPSFAARTDTGGTGGLSAPTTNGARYDEHDDTTLCDENGSSSGASPARDESRSRSSTLVDHPERSNSRPLPQLPPRRGAVDQSLDPDQANAAYGMHDSFGGSYGLSAAMIQKTSPVSGYGQPPVLLNKISTDVDPHRRGGSVSARTGGYESALSPEMAYLQREKLGELVLPDLPAGKRRKFVPAKLTAHDFKRCPEPWAFSGILAWLQEMTEGEADLREHLLADGLVSLFTAKVPTMNVADAETLGAQLVDEMFARGALMHEEEWVKFTGIKMTGVVFQLTGDGCYAPKLHSTPGTGRCYSHHCMRTLKKIDLTAQDLAPQRKTEDWATFYKLKKEDIENVDKKEIERQNNLHEIVTSEDVYMDQLDVLLGLYRDGLRTSPQPIMSQKRVEEFIREVFGKVQAVKQVNEDYLLAQLKYRQEEQGPWVRGFSDIFREWIRKAKTAYIEYAGAFPNASLRVRKEAERNVLFRQFLDQVQQHERSRRLGWDTYLKSPITRLQRYSLLLATVYKHSVQDNEEKRNLEKAIEEIKNVTLDCDARVAEMGKRADLLELGAKLKLRVGMERDQLNLDHLGREIIFRGDLQRRSTNKISWVDTHAILFDHYMVLAKPVQQRDTAGGVRHEVYDVSKLPIPMDLLVLESTNDEAVMKSAVKGLTAANPRAQGPQGGNLNRATSNTTATTNLSSAPPTNSSMSISSGSSRQMANQTVLDAANDKILYPFRIKHLGKLETYTLYASTAANRQDWCDKIIEAKTRHASSLFAQNAEPFRLRVLADTAFNYDSSYAGPPSVVIKGTPLDRSIEDCDKSFYGTGPRAGPICRTSVNCATSFSQAYGPRMMAVGTDFGVYLSEYSNPRGWVKCAAITGTNVTQIQAIEEFSLFLIISDKSLIAYNLESVCPSKAGPPSAEARKAPQKLSGSRDVGFFVIGRQKERLLIFYKKKDGISSTFKVLEPVYQRGGGGRSRFGLKKGATDYCREFDEFYIPSNCYTINLFEKSLAISTDRGIEVMTLDKKQPLSIPDVRSAEVASIAARIKDQKPLGMFRLSDNEFLLVFTSVGIYVDKHGEISRAVVMEFVGTAKEATLYNNTFLVLVDKSGDFVEVRNAINGRLRQVVSGRDVRMLDPDVGSEGGTMKICMQHPERERVQLVIEMIVNENLKE